MVVRFYCLFLCGFFCVLEAAEFDFNFPLATPETNAITHRWLQKPVLNSRMLDEMESVETWKHRGFGEMAITAEKAFQGKHSIRLTSPTKTEQQNKVSGRPFGEAAIRRVVPNEDWSSFNRLAFRVYPVLPGFHTISMLVQLHNEGAEKVPGGYGRDGLNFFLLKPNQWNHIVWEIPNLSRDKVTGVEFVYRLQGNEPGATNVVCFYIDQLELQQVEPDHFEGWNVANGAIAYSHSGYMVGSEKTALASGLTAKEFKLIRLLEPGEPGHGEVVLNKPIQTTRTDLGEFQVMDFSEYREKGRYLLKAGTHVTKPFTIEHDPWVASIVKTLNLFYCERCGVEVPGVHGVCHADWNASYDGKKIIINGGWHDAGDLSQGSVNSAEAAYAMGKLAEKVETEYPDLARRLWTEAEWGLQWLLKTRLTNGRRVTWATMDFWTDNEIGTADDVSGEVGSAPFDLFIAATTEAYLARSLKNRNSPLAEQALKAAREDWEIASKELGAGQIEPVAAGILAAIELFLTTGEQEYANFAFQHADFIIKSQQRVFPKWRVPLRGFFYTHPDKQRILHYSHRGHEQGPAVALAALCAQFPTHSDFMRWYSSLLLYSEYLRSASRYTEPYSMLTASIYDIEESGQASFKAQVSQGIQLSDRHYLRRFPVWFELRGNHGTLLSQASGLAAAALVRNDLSLIHLVKRQLQWVVGRNPFAQSTMWGEGFDFAPQYSAMSGNMVGGLPVGIQTRGDRDLPYWPAANCYNYKEVWVHPSSRWLMIQAQIGGPATVSGRAEPNIRGEAEFTELNTNLRYTINIEKKKGTFAGQLPPGKYLAAHGNRERQITLLPGSSYVIDLFQPFWFELQHQKNNKGEHRIKLKGHGDGRHKIKLKLYNLEVTNPEQTIEVTPEVGEDLNWTAKVIDPGEPCIVIAIADDDLGIREELAFDP
ncbi:MAG: glycoside hydrolase family 9 protein [Verrucomicrobiota bacterium]|nr:glycoside hydrolase family 9 protein [Verrucomicrobiota bacterium]